MKATINDVAKRAGVSMKTVSRVLNKEPNVAVKTRERVTAIARELNYTPNFAARGLASSKSYLLALMYDDINPIYVMEIQNGAIDVCREHGYHLVLEPVKTPIVSWSNPKAHEDLTAELETRLKGLAVDGVILTPPLCDSQTVLGILKRLNIASVRVGPSQNLTHANNYKYPPAIFMDDKQAAFDVTEALIATGHKDLGFIEGHKNHGSSYLRLEGFKAATEKHNLIVPKSRIVQGDYTFQSGIAAANALLSESGARPTAIFASNDDMAAGVVSVANRLGVNVPSDLSVCGFDDAPIARKMSPQLSSVCQPIYEMGNRAVKLLLARKDDSLPRLQIVDYKLVFRGSTARCLDKE
ncbi:MAG: LacI family DNA-binding transcriptional regulator [Litorimonas sp.]